MGAALFPGVGKGAVLLRLSCPSGIHFALGGCSVAHPLPNPQTVWHPPRQKQLQSKTITCNAKYLGVTISP